MTQNNLHIRPFRSGDADLIAGWDITEETFYRWTAGIMGEYPITADRLREATAARIDNDRYFPFVLMEDDRVAGFFILRQPGEDREVLRFGFVIVDPAIQGKGYGRAMLELGMRYAFTIHGAKKMTLGVFADNAPAYNCYKRVGFRETGETESYTLRGETWTCVEMELVP